MQALDHICSRYDNAANFQAPASIWFVSTEKECHIVENCAVSISLYALAVIGNIHNSVMSSDSAKWTKIAIVLLLDAASLVVFALALPETLIRGAVGIACLPFFLLAACVQFKDLANALIFPLMTAIFTFAQMPNALHTVLTLTTSSGTINPFKDGTEFYNFITCNACR